MNLFCDLDCMSVKQEFVSVCIECKCLLVGYSSCIYNIVCWTNPQQTHDMINYYIFATLSIILYNIIAC